MTLSTGKSFHFLRNMPQYFWVLLVIFTVTFGVLMLDHFRVYTSEVTLLVVHTNEKTSASAPQVVENIRELPQTLAFYNRLLAQFPEINDPWSDLQDDERKMLWLQKISVSKVNESGLITMKITADTALDAKLLAEKSTATLFQTVGLYYDIRNELSLRTIEPAVASVSIERPFGWFLASISAGFIAALTVSFGVLGLSLLTNRIRFIKPQAEKKETPVSTLRPVTFEALPQEKTTLYQKFGYQVPTKTEAKTTFVRTPSAVAEDTLRQEVNTIALEKTSELTSKPAALPKTTESIAGLPFLEEGMSLEDMLFGTAPLAPDDTLQKPSSKVEEAIEEVSLPADMKTVDDEGNLPLRQATEPTPEELKRRLNQLLKGDM